ncbi:AI-2E family transporter [Luteolibacter flavescens]|uniref:AI-2E family transporter n=1 Tax=Luteolibacter flavescens TaxID=1859460 RepID=A0ABT3FVX9_9BACT|nr:AI-2E family transporter [Luteolibacter flavescens]MCW1887746.1 AI-2E family transporter [Luteolibacter flavescens]
MSTPGPARLPARKRRSASDSLSGIFAVCLVSALMVGLYFGKDVLIPLALAVLITFLLTPLVNKIQRWIGNVAATLAAMFLILATTVSLAWMVGNQAVDLAEQLPGYKENIRTKLRSFQIPSGGVLSRLSETFEDLKKDLPGMADQGGEGGEGGEGQAGGTPTAQQPMPVEVVKGAGQPGSMDTVQTMLAQVAGPLGTGAMVFLLATFMLLKREDLRSRLLRLIGQGRISATTRAFDEAGTRVRKYLLMQLVINVTYGIPLAIGLYFIGVPNAVLWGALAAGLRFIPYIGPWIAAAFPVLLSLAVSRDWNTPLLTIGLFVVLELVSNNVLEPWLYGTSTGVSPVALIVSAVFWTWMWGTAGLVLSTPFTVCLVVMGRHIPQLSFLSVMLGEEEALTPADDCYQRLLRQGEHDEMELAESYLRTKPLAELYDSMLIPVMIAAERDHRDSSIDRDQRNQIVQAMGELVEDLSERPTALDTGVKEDATAVDCLVSCLAARAERDEMAGSMLVHVLKQQRFEAKQLPARRVVSEILGALRRDEPDLVCISAVAPSTTGHARTLCRRVRDAFPDVKIAVGLWGKESDMLGDDTTSLKEAGADEVFTSIADMTAYAKRLASALARETVPASRPANEEERLVTLDGLGLVNPEREPVLDHVTAKLARVFDVPMAAITLVDRDRQWFKSHVGLPSELDEEGGTPRDLSICGHVVAADDMVVVRDLKRDRRFAKNPIVVEHGIRFYAGAPIRVANGQTIGALCLMDTEPRQLNRQESRLLQANAAEIAEELERLAEVTT